MKETWPNGAIRFHHGRYPGGIAFLVRVGVEPIKCRIIVPYFGQLGRGFGNKTGLEMRRMIVHDTVNDIPQILYVFPVREDLVLPGLIPGLSPVKGGTAYVCGQEADLMQPDICSRL